jgi:ADP-heptose:LPS heptosyltransferase
LGGTSAQLLLFILRFDKIREDLVDGPEVKVLVARTDKLGDVVLSLPVFEYIKTKKPDWEVQALVGPGALPLVENDPHLSAIWTYRDEDLPVLAEKLGAERFDAAILLFFHRPLATILKRAKVRRRVGPLSKFWSWFLLNRGVWQNRSRVRHHERDYNIQLAQKLVGKGGEFPLPKIYLTDGQREIGRRFLRDEASSAAQVVFVHPGSGGSALNWPPERFAAIANALVVRDGIQVFLTGSPEDRPVVESVSEFLEPEVKVIAEQFPLRDFLGVLSAGDLLVGPSTGPLHMAAALGLGVVGLYPPITTQSISRWGPLGPWSRALMPDSPCPARLVCYGDRCRHWNCMQGIEVEQILEAATATLRDRSAQAGADPLAQFFG